MAAYLHLAYLFATVFGVGVMALDLLGVFVHTTDGAIDSANDGAHVDDVSQADADHATVDHATDHSSANTNHLPILSILRYLRMFVYFCAGFGPLGLIAEFNGSSLLATLAWSLLGGITSTALGLFMFRLQRKDLDSTVKTEDLFLGQAQVIVPITNGNMGKVRIHIGQSVAERYALAENSLESFHKDAIVEVIRVTDECVYVRPATTDHLVSRIAKPKPTPQLQK